MNSSNAVKSLLLRAGLDDREVAIYLAALVLKVAPASAIAKKARQQRSNTYLVLESLKKKGLLSEIQKNKSKHFVAESPTRLLNFVEDQKGEIDQVHTLLQGVMPLLESVTEDFVDKPRVTMQAGLGAMKQVYKDILHHEFVGAFNTENVYKLFKKPIPEALLPPKTQLKGREFVVNNASGRKHVAEYQMDSLESKLLPEGMYFEGDIIIFKDTTAFFAYDSELTLVTIENRNIAQILKIWFELLWAKY